MRFFVSRKKFAFSILTFGFFVALAIIGNTFLGSDSIQHASFAVAQSTATTTVTVLNTPPNWTENPFTSPASNTSTPTNAGSNVTFLAIGTSPNNNNYYLLICMTSSTPTPNAGAAPTCGGGNGNQWAVSTSTVSGATSTAIYTSTATSSQINPWFAWICDGQVSNPRCNATYEQGSGGSGSPFVIDHAPSFTVFSNNSPANPGQVVTWTTAASDTDNFTGSTSTVQLFVCKATDFSGGACGAGGTVCSSTASLSNPSCSSTISIPTQNGGYATYGYVINPFNFPAQSGAEGADATETVNAVAPTITSSSINLLNVGGSSTPLSLTNPGGQTTGFEVTFTASDNNSCLSPSSGQEVATASIDVFRTGVGLGSCSSTGNYNANNCYPAAAGTSTWAYSCSQNGGSCSGSSSINSQWTCTFPLWYNADPTDGTATSTQYYNQAWAAAVQATNYLGTTSTVVLGTATNSVLSFLASQLNSPSVSFGSLEPGSSTPVSATTTLSELGNLGLNETLYGTSMCATYPSCPVSTTSTIPVGQLVYASASVAYTSGTALAVNPGNLFLIQIPKSTSTATSSLGTTYWGISVPSTIQLSGAYTGQNTFVAVRSSPSAW